MPIVMLPEKGSEDDTLVEHYAFLDPDRPHKYGRVWLSVRNDLKTPLVQSSLFEGHASMVHAASSLDRMESKGEQALVRSKSICTLEEWLQDKMGVEPNASENTSSTRLSDLCRVAIRDGGDRASILESSRRGIEEHGAQPRALQTAQQQIVLFEGDTSSAASASLSALPPARAQRPRNLSGQRHAQLRAARWRRDVAPALAACAERTARVARRQHDLHP